MDRFFYSTELVTFLFCLVIFCFVLYTRPKRTRACVLCLYGLFSLTLEMLCEFLLHLYARFIPEPKNLGFLLILFAHFPCHICVLLLLAVYLDGISIHHFLTKLPCKITAFCTTLISLGVFTFFAYKDWLYDYANHSIRIPAYTMVLNIVSAVGTMVVFIFVLAHKKEFPRGLIHMILFSLPIMIALQILQVYFCRQLFHGCIYLMPLMILYFFYHNNPYDERTGYQDMDSFETMFHACLQTHKKVHFIYIKIPKLDDISFMQRLQIADAHSSIIVTTSRKLEYSCKRTRLYRLSNSSFAILFPETTSQKDTVTLKTIREILFEGSQQGGPEVYFYAIHFHHIENIASLSDCKKMIQYILEQHDNEPVDVWIDPTVEDYQTYNKLIEVEEILTSIVEDKNPDDPRILCYAQPIYDVHSRSFHTAEALIRMQNDGKMIFPDQFIPLAEKMGCVHTLTYIMLNKICSMIPTLQKEKNFEAITINCSATELCDQNLYQDITGIIKQHGVNPSCIRIELTESAMFENYDAMMFNIKRLHEFGIQFYLDDFGTGFSNFERIMTCPLYIIKFDKSLLYKAFLNPSIDNLLTNLIFIFKQANLHILMEGVENESQSEFCVERGIEYIQGYHYAKPIPIEQIAPFFSKEAL